MISTRQQVIVLWELLDQLLAKPDIIDANDQDALYALNNYLTTVDDLYVYLRGPKLPKEVK